MSTHSLPSSPESVSDEDNHPKARPWYEPSGWTPEELGIVPSPKRKRRALWASTAWVHHPDPVRIDRAANRSEKREEEAEAKREEKALRRRIKKTRDSLDDMIREENLRALEKQQMADRAADWKN